MAGNSSEVSSTLFSTTTVLHQDVSHRESNPEVDSTNLVLSAQQSSSKNLETSSYSRGNLASSSAHSSIIATASVHQDPSVLVLQSSLTSDIESSSKLHLSSSPSMSSSRQPVIPLPSQSPTPPLTSIQELPYQTSNFKLPSLSSSLSGSSDLDTSVQFTSHISSSSSITSSSSVIPPILPTSGSTTTNGSISSSPPSSLTDNLTVILGISLCGVAILVLLIIVLFWCCRKRSKTKQQTVETVQIGDLWANDRQDISFAPTFDSVLESVSESPKTNSKTNKDILYKVLYPYTAQDESQINLDLGDIVTLIEKRGNGWWKGKIKDKEGWFPGSYVEEAEIGLGYTPNQHLPNGHSPVSSFLKDQDITPKLTKNNSNRNSAPVFSFDKKVLGKEVSIPKVPPTTSPYLSPHSSQPTSPGHSNISYCHEKIITENVEGVRFLVLYSHEPNFSNELHLNIGDVVIGIEKDMNGWMKGKKQSSGEVGMFPAIYVQEIFEEEFPHGYKDKQSVYDQLPVSYNDTSTAEYIGVEHYAVCPYAAEIETDLSFDIGDTIIVCQTLDNGWWYGCHGDQFGWFPGTYVEMVEDEIDGSIVRNTTHEGEKTHDELPESTVICDKPLETTIDKDIAALSPIKPHSGNKSEDEMSQKSTDSVDKKSKIPKTVSKDSPNKRSKLPMAVRPNRPAPPPPVQHHSTPESKTNLMDKFNKTKNTASKDKIGIKKPDVPKRFIKPKLRKVPKQKTKAGNESELCRRKVRSPPPPRPELPKLLREKYSINRNQVRSANCSNIQDNSLGSDLPDSSVQNDVRHTDTNEPAVIEVDNDANQSVVCDSSQNMTSFLENSVTTDTSFGKMSGLTSLSSSVQGERTHDQSELTNVSAFNVSDINNDSKQILIKQNSVENNQTADNSGHIVQENNLNGPMSKDTDDGQIGNVDDSQNSANQKSANSDNQTVSKIPPPKSYSMKEDSPKQTLIPKSQSMKTNSPKPPPVAPKPNKASVGHCNSHYDDPGYSQVGAGLVGQDVVDGPEKFPLYKRPQSPIYSRIDKKCIVPNQNGPIQSSSGRPFVEGSIKSELNGHQKTPLESCVDPPCVHEQESDYNAQDLDHCSGNKGDSDIDTDHVISKVNGSPGLSENGPSASLDKVSHNSVPKPSMIPGPGSPQPSSIPKRTMSPVVKRKQGGPHSSIPKPNMSSVNPPEKDHKVGNGQDHTSKPERPSRPPNVVRHSSLSSPSPSRLPKVEKSRSMRAESPSVARKHQKPKQTKDVSKIPSGIPKSPAPKQKAPTPQKSPHTGSRLPRMNGFVSPKPKRPPPPKSPPVSPTYEDSETNLDHEFSPVMEGIQMKNGNSSIKQTAGSLLKRTIASYTAVDEDELSFQEGTFITEISQDEKSGICVGMLPNGQTGLYHRSYVEDSIEAQQSVV